MADFDNGLPPVGTTTGGQISDINLQSEEFITDDVNHIKAVSVDKGVEEKSETIHITNVTMNKDLYQKTDPAHIKTVLLCKEAAGINYGTFL